MFELISKKIVTPLHSLTITQRRTQVIGDHLLKLLPSKKHLEGIDVGCGSGGLAKYIQNRNNEIIITGVDILGRKDAAIEIIEFDGIELPFDDKSFDFVMLVDVLHHTDKPILLIEECIRVTRKYILIKDHICNSWWDNIRLRFMDWVGNRGYEVYLPYNYLSQKDWEILYKSSALISEIRFIELNLYPWPFTMLFDGTLHFIERISI